MRKSAGAAVPCSLIESRTPRTTGTPIDLLTAADILCTTVFAITGALAAVESRMDLGGCFILAFVTGTGGGTLRDLLLDREVFWLAHHAPIYMCLAAAIITFFATRSVGKLRPAIVWIDALGLALFCVTGAGIALEAGAAPVICVMMGALSATGGGVIREMIRNEMPIVLQRDIYITAALAGAFAFVLLDGAGVHTGVATTAGAVVAFALRGAGIVFNLSLPGPKALPGG